LFICMQDSGEPTVDHTPTTPLRGPRQEQVQNKEKTIYQTPFQRKFRLLVRLG